MRSVGWIGFSGLALLCACTFNRGDHPEACSTQKDCDSNESCVSGFCVAAAPVGMTKQDGGGDAAGPSGDGGDQPMPDAARPGEPCAEGTPPQSCYDGPADTEDVGECRSGQRACVGGVFTQCLGQVLPEEEVCNQRDDDCDGTEDEIEMGDCDTQMRGICAQGLLMCRGAIGVCEVQNPPVNETCNGLDDDCDGNTDEIPSSECFPADATGCTRDADGVYTCSGLCRTGHLSCVSGQGGCEEAVVAVDEVCTPANGDPVDENCNDQVDEGCACSSGTSRACYAGPAGTLGHGQCAAGQQACGSDNTWGPCEGQTLPAAETCANSGADDNCDGIEDNVPGLGEPCIDDSKKGICREGVTACVGDSVVPVCKTKEPQQELCDDIDQNCDGNPTDGFDLNSNENCGECGRKCDNGTTCCNGDCVPVEEFRHDANNCGGCGNRCGRDMYCCWNDCLPAPSGGITLLGGATKPPKSICGCESDCRDRACCGDQCVDILNDVKNCGACGNDCTASGFKSTCCNGRCTTLLCAAER